MKVKNIIETINQECFWKDLKGKTRDRLLVGEEEQEVEQIFVCWVMTYQVIKEAIQKDVHLIISHENPFYTSGTNLDTCVFEEMEKKRKLCKEHAICVYRCHDVWDLMPDYGVSDTWARKLGYPFQERQAGSYYHVADVEETCVYDVAKHVADVLKEDGEEGVYVFGDVDKKVHRLAIGTGAATHVVSMMEYGADCLIVSDDGISNFFEGQFAIDLKVPLIVVNHAGCEIGGIKRLADFINEKMPVRAVYIDEGFHISYIL